VTDRARLRAYLDGNEEARLAELAELVGFASISADPAAGPAIAGCIEWLVRECHEAGFEEVEVFPGEGNPIIVARLRSPRADAPTILLYGHYDVQPADPAEWTTPPFAPDVREGRMYGRGVSDNKAPIMINLSAVRACRELDGAPPCHLIYVIEGDEERSAEPLRAFGGAHAELLAADVLHVADSWMHEPGVPAVTTAVRGMAALDFSVSTARWNLHSGIYGGAVPNAVGVLAGLLASLHDATGRVAVEGFYDRVEEVGDDQRARWAAFAPDPAAYLADAGARYLAGEAGYTLLEQVWARPTLELNGAWGGYLGEGIHTIVPAKAHAKITCRLVADQDPQETIDQIVAHLERRLPDGAELAIESTLAGAVPLAMEADSPAIRAAAAALEEVWERPAVVGRSGYSVPAAETLAKHAGGNAFLMGFALAGERAHGSDEHFHLENFRKGIEATVCFWRAYADSGH
jgi:acetylornithine deacetylase/succinyl-diaminopimelate desuccinylase-like protein